MKWLEKLLEETIAANAYLFWKKYVQKENRDENSEDKDSDEESDGQML